MNSILKGLPTLRYGDISDTESAWMLEFVFNSDVTYQLQIRHDAIEYKFSFWKWEDGEPTELISMLTLKEMIADYLEHEGGDAETARAWVLDAQKGIHRTRGLMGPAVLELFEDMKRYWTALTVIVNPEVTL
jgi:hypothetical protein